MNGIVVRGTNLAVKIRQHTVIHDMNLELSDGVTALLGPNGAGKTTLARVLATALRPTSGTLNFFGYELAQKVQYKEVRRRIGYGAQHSLVLGHLSVVEQVAYAGWLKGLSKTSAMSRAHETLKLVGLERRAKSRTRSLSGGMIKRMNIAMALVHEPDFIILDEPTAGLDPEQRNNFQELIVELGRRSSVLLSTHLLEDVASVCNNVIVMLGGRSVFSGSVNDLASYATLNGSGPETILEGYSLLTEVKQR
ncbi:ATP-binding cassette domain-containing protein [Actinoplanes sp. NPDC049596]|uniref:ABC transporter ATP-binding protein n=1 Tax=unclassified Actinoplanes TaxID=2626549 RepID=UPI00341AF222